jgi:hypothetical protein
MDSSESTGYAVRYTGIGAGSTSASDALASAGTYTLASGLSTTSPTASPAGYAYPLDYGSGCATSGGRSTTCASPTAYTEGSGSRSLYD